MDSLFPLLLGLWNIPSALGSIGALVKATELQDKWSKQTEPSKYMKAGWGGEDVRVKPTSQLQTGIGRFLRGSRSNPAYSRMMKPGDIYGSLLGAK